MKTRLGIWQYIKSYRFNCIFIKNLIMILLIIIIPLVGMSMAVYRTQATSDTFIKSQLLTAE